MSFLSEILDRKREEVAASRRIRSESELRERTKGAPAPRSLFDALSFRGGPTQVIAEVKRASPSVGTIDASVDAPVLASRYASAGAAAISVLTDGKGFGGSLDDLAEVRLVVDVPVLRKDFSLEPYQLVEARAWGADAALLIVAAFEAPGGHDVPKLRALLAEAAALGLEALVEVHDARELDVALGAGAKLVGINNRNLATFQVDLATSEALLPTLPAEVKAVAESGVKSAADASRLRRAGAANLLVGEALVRAGAGAGNLLAALRSAG